MFRSLASYLMGGAAAAALPQSPAGAAEAEVGLLLSSTDDDWVLVDNNGPVTNKRLTAEAEDEDSAGCGTVWQRLHPREPSPSVEGASAGRPLSPTAPSDDFTLLRHSSRSSSSSSLRCVEESWFITPPPSFTSMGPVHMEMSPLENLLIEHPSMSVYHQHTAAFPHWAGPPSFALEDEEPELVLLLQTPRDSIPEAELPVIQRLPTPPPPPQPVATIAPPRGALRQLVQPKTSLQLKSAQKSQQHRACQGLKRNHLDRQNKAREYKSKNKVQRRSDRMLHHSGANNNRKC